MNYDTARLYNGVRIHAQTESSPSGLTAVGTLSDPDSYLLDLTLHVRWPKPALTSEELIAATPELSQFLPGLEKILLKALPSPDFASLQARKERFLKANLVSLQKLPYRDSLFDCQTVLKFSQPAALLIQAIMNVNTDGSDGDRNLEIDKLSATFQPQTNYRWPKTGDHPNPCLREAEAHLALLDGELGNGTLTAERKSSLEKERASAKATVEELKRWSFLVGTADPFIVLPSFMVGKEPGQPKIGDYAVVIANGMLYPAVLGDLGPSNKIGEASLRLCRAIDPKSGADRRPASHPGIIYLVFPGSAEKPFGPPNYKHWSERCHALWKEFGGDESAPWHEWTSLEHPWPTPTPTPPVSSETHLGTQENRPPVGTDPAAVEGLRTPTVPAASESPAPL